VKTLPAFFLPSRLLPSALKPRHAPGRSGLIANKLAVFFLCLAVLTAVV
jgi:hypothetical protein